MLLKMVSRLLAQHVPVLTLTGNQRPGASVPPLAPMYSPLPPTIDLKTSVNAFMDHVLDVLDEMGTRYHHQPITTRGQRLRSTTVVSCLCSLYVNLILAYNFMSTRSSHHRS